MPATGRRPTPRRVTGPAGGVDGDVEPVAMRCACGHVQVELLDSDGLLRPQMRDVSCGRCGRLGQMGRNVEVVG